MRSIAIVLLMTLMCSTAAASDASVPSSTLYQQLVSDAQTGKPNVDYTLLRLSYAKTDGYDPWGMTTQQSFMEAWNAFSKGDCDTAMKSSEEVMEKDFTRIPMHSVRQSCLEKAGKKDDAAVEFAIGKGLNDSLLSSGDGKTPQSAYVVISLKEEGYVLSALDCRETMQSLIFSNGHSYDVLTCTDNKTGESRGVNFQIDNVSAGEMKMFKPKT